jgi:hypothetical protein
VAVQETALINPVAVQETALAKIKALKGSEPRGCVDFDFNGISDQLIIAPNPIGIDFTISFWMKTKQ